MNVENQVCSLELARKLKELGVPQHSLWIWLRDEDGEFGIGCGCGCYSDVIEQYSAFAVAELGAMLPGLFTSEKDGERWNGGIYGVIGREADTEANLRAMILIELIEQRKIDVEKLAETGEKCGNDKVCQCEDKDNCPHEYPIFKGGKLLNPMKAGARYTDDFGNEKW